MSMTEQPIDTVGRTLRDAFAALDDLVVMAADESTRNTVMAERVMIGMLLTRCQLLASQIDIAQPGKLRIVKNG